ncbi:MAG: sensor histidine kinase [Ekhidna sp.]|nr:sensor histidine kinase [Ekhidna sp.]
MLNLRPLHLVLALLFRSSLGFCQISQTDSVEVINLIRSSEEAVYINADSARILALKALRISNQTDYSFGQGLSLSKLGVSYQVQGQYDSALFFLNQSLEIWHDVNDSAEIANVTNNIGIVYDEKGIDDLAIANYAASLRIFEALNHELGMAKVYNNLGIIYKKNKQFDLVAINYLKALRIYENVGHTFGQAATRGNLGSVYLELKKYDSSILFSEASISGYSEAGIDQFVPYSLENIGLAYRGLGELDQAKKYHEEALVLYKAYGNQKETAFSLGSLSEIHLAQSAFIEAKQTAQEAFDIASSIGALEELERSSELLTKSLIFLGDSESAGTAFLEYIKLSDSLSNKDRSTAIAEVQVKYETDKKDQEIKTLAAESELQELRIAKSRWVTLMIAVISIALILGLILINTRKRYQMKVQMAEEKDRLQKNSFNAVIEAEEKERKRIAQELHDGLGQLLSTARLSISSLEDENVNEQLAHAIKMIDMAVDETRNISHNLMPNALTSTGLKEALLDLGRKVNKSGSLHLELSIEDLSYFNESQSISIYRIVQEVLNNTIKYADARNIWISAWVDSDTHLEIKDDGMGFDTKFIEHNEGIGWKNIQSRVTLLGGEWSVCSKLEEGTTVKIKLPKYESDQNIAG